MHTRTFLADLGTGLIAGYVGTRAMTPVTTLLYERVPEEVRARERAAQAEPAYEVAARKTAAAVGLQLSPEQQQTGGMVLHWGLGLGWGIITTLLRRATGLHPVVAGLVSGLAMFVLIDEGANTAFGFAARPSAYPAATHLRGLVGHLVYGVASAVAAEMISVLGRAGGRR